MKILFIGTVEFSLQALTKLIEMGEEVVGVITKEQSVFNADFADLTSVCERHGIPYLFCKNINDDVAVQWMNGFQPDIAFCFGWSQIIRPHVLAIPKKGVVGFHPAYLPKNRGRHPLIWALVLGLKESATTFFMMDEGADSGDIVSQKQFDITYEDDAASLYQKMIDNALSQIEDFVPALRESRLTPTPQDHSKANLWRKRGRKDGEIDFRMNSRTIYNLVRGLTKPYVGAHLMFGEAEVKIWKVREVTMNTNNLEPGLVLEANEKSVIVKTASGAVEILEHEFKSIPEKGTYL